MGQGMVRNLLAEGATVTVYTRTRAKIDAMTAEGATGASSANELAAAADIVLACLPDVPASRDVFLGERGVLANARRGQIFVDHSTVDIATSRLCAEAAEQRGAFFLDAPISGGPDGASAGTLTIMVGGEQHPYDTARPYFDMMGARVVRLGASGAGTAMKLINQLLVGVHNRSGGRGVCASELGWRRSPGGGGDPARQLGRQPNDRSERTPHSCAGLRGLSDGGPHPPQGSRHHYRARR